MLAVKSAPSVCLTCRLSLLASHVRNANSPARSRHLQLRGASYVRNVAQRRAFTSTAHRASATETATNETIPEEEASPEILSVEETVRRARQLYGHVLPHGHLGAEEYKVYERLYGTPVFIDKVEDIEEVDGEEVTVFAEEQADGSTVLLRKLSDGEYEEVEILNEFEEDVEGEGEELEKQRTMTEAEWQEYREQKAEAYHRDVYDQSMEAREEALEEVEEEEEEDDFMRAHPLTVAGRSRTSPSTVYLPKETLVEPVAELLTRANPKHLAESTNRIFGGSGLPFSAATVPSRLAREQKAIPIDPSHAETGNIEADAYLAAVMPGTYATVMSTLVEVRKRLGTPWIEHLFKKKGGPMVLDAGAGGAGVLAWHEVLRAEWQRMHEESGSVSKGEVPLGKSTVLTAANTLRHRASRLLENTTFIPRLPDLEGAERAGAELEEHNTQQPRKLYDIIIAPHTLWPLKQEYQRKDQVEKYWSLLNPKGGVLIILEKGLPRGFEVVAAARQHLLDKRIASPSSTETPVTDDDAVPKETGMIIAPCTNHNKCPMYASEGISAGRKDFCYFSQRYIRPPYLQRILNATDRNHEDVQFSYLAVQRGRDQRLPVHDLLGKGVVQDDTATLAAFEGHEWKASESGPAEDAEPEVTTAEDVNPLALPRLVLPALKRRGHIVLDVCTPSGTLERWTVPRSFSKQAFRDARKAQWGDLWALGAKTRIPKNVRLGRPRDEFDKKGRRIKVQKKQVYEIDVGSQGVRGVSAKRDGRFAGEGWDRKIRGSGGRKGRRRGVEALEELD